MISLEMVAARVYPIPLTNDNVIEKPHSNRHKRQFDFNQPRPFQGNDGKF